MIWQRTRLQSRDKTTKQLVPGCQPHAVCALEVVARALHAACTGATDVHKDGRVKQRVQQREARGHRTAGQAATAATVPMLPPPPYSVRAPGRTMT